MRAIFFIVALVMHSIIYVLLFNLFIITKILLNLCLFISICLKFIIR